MIEAVIDGVRASGPSKLWPERVHHQGPVRSRPEDADQSEAADTHAIPLHPSVEELTRACQAKRQVDFKWAVEALDPLTAVDQGVGAGKGGGR